MVLNKQFPLTFQRLYDNVYSYNLSTCIRRKCILNNIIVACNGLLLIINNIKKTNAKLPINVNFTCFIVSYTFLFFTIVRGTVLTR